MPAGVQRGTSRGKYSASGAQQREQLLDEFEQSRLSAASATGKKLPLAMVGTSQTPHCFRLVDHEFCKEVIPQAVRGGRRCHPASHPARSNQPGQPQLINPPRIINPSAWLAQGGLITASGLYHIILIPGTR